ncbi:hypothetical protein O6H91_21G010000 [Diphasiastrum complanatum]|uniref:Uncharacterized protein n=1 Tax=Diphasiastrum complanatum TaxID=34168 RepID=A0ACC2AHN5_DIPCM|nr:hypothetical protein O6H91_21G010000 [Diphasiastrum complanatum]
MSLRQDNVYGTIKNIETESRHVLHEPMLDKRVINSAKDRASFLSFVAALSYGFTSLAMVFINKALLMRYPYSLTLLTLQVLSSLQLPSTFPETLFTKLLGSISAILPLVGVQQVATALLVKLGGSIGVSKPQKFDVKSARKLFPLSLFYNANVAFALASLKGVNIPMYIALKRLTPLAILITGFLTGKARPPFQVTLAVITTGVGVIVAALGDFSFDLLGYTMALTSVLFQTIYLVLVEKSGAEDGMSSTDLMFYNSILSFPFLMSLIVISGEAKVAVPLLLTQAKSINFFVTVVLSLVMGIALNFTMFLCTIVNSALTTTIVGVLKGVGSTLFGFILLGGVEIHALNVLGLIINTFGGIWYSFAKYFQKSRKARKTEPLLPKSFNAS